MKTMKANKAIFEGKKEEDILVILRLVNKFLPRQPKPRGDPWGLTAFDRDLNTKAQH